MNNKFPGKDVTLLDLKEKFPLAAKKIKIINLKLIFVAMYLVAKKSQYSQAQIWLKVKN